MTAQIDLDLAGAIDILRELPAATIYEANDKRGDMSPEIRPVFDGARFCGPAYTLRVMPSNNEGVLRALALAPAGCVLVIDGGGTSRSTTWGGTSSSLGRRQGLAGCVTNAAVRDLGELRDIGFPVFAMGVSVRGALKSHPGWHQIPVSVGDMVVCPGDLVIGDDDGVVVVERAQISLVAWRARALMERDEARAGRLATGADIYAEFGLQMNGV
jgi:4-hydroxy-4-methyl-2-oxoglutarate aldolase